MERKELSSKLDMEEGRKEVFKIAKQIAKTKEDVVGVRCLKNEMGEMLVDPNAVKNRWKQYIEKLLNVENEWDGEVGADIVEGPPDRIRESEVANAIKASKSGKAGGPT